MAAGFLGCRDDLLVRRTGLSETDIVAYRVLKQIDVLQTLTIAPTPNPALGWAKAVYDSPVGRIESGWQYAGDAVTYTITVPCNLTAEVTLPDGRSLTLQPGNHTL